MIKKLFILATLLLTSVAAMCQGPLTATQLSISSGGGQKEWASVYLPKNYTTSKKYPLIVFFHGAGETGTTEADLANIYNSTTAGGPMYLIAHGQWPDSFYNYRDGKYYQPIVIAPQASSWSTPTNDFPYLISDILSKYSVDTNRIYFTGLSAGGAVTWNYIAHYQVTPNYTAAAVVLMSAASNPDATDAGHVVADSVRFWGFGDVSGDFHGLQTQEMYEDMNAIKPGMARFTNTPGTGHGGWNLHYITTYTESIYGYNMNIYNWMLWWTRGPSVPKNIAPAVNAGSDQSLSSGTTSATLSGSASDPDGSIVSHIWTQVSGTTVGIDDVNSYSTTVSGLEDGKSYTFKLSATDDSSATSTDQVTISVGVNQPPVVNAGNDTTIVQPANSANLNGHTSDDHTIASFEWSIVNQPHNANAQVDDNESLNTTITDLDSAGTYTIRLSATDDAGQTSTDDKLITVAKASGGGDTARFQFGPYGMVATEGWAHLFGNPSGRVLSATQNGITVSTVATNQWYPLSQDTSRGAKSQGASTGDNSGVVPDNVLKGFALTLAYYGQVYNGITQGDNIKISGLIPYGYYNIEMGASVDTEQVGSYERGYVEYRVNTTDIDSVKLDQNSSKQATFTNIQADATGAVMVAVHRFSGYTGDGIHSQYGHIGWLIVEGQGTSNTPPTADAGNDTTYSDGVTSITLDGSGSYDSDGSIASYQWEKYAGDTGTVTITSPTSSTTTVTGISDDTTYSFKLTITDDGGLSSSKVVNITVGTPYVGNPVVSAGYPQLLADGTTSATLSGTVTVDGGSVASSKWKLISGSGAVLSFPNNLTTTVSNLEAGKSYRFRLIAANNVGAKDSAEVVIAVNDWYPEKNDTIITTTLPGYHLIGINHKDTPGIYGKDTISILGGTYEYISLDSLIGASGKPILVRPVGGPVQITSNVAGGTAGLLINSCQYLHVDGGSLPDTVYGFNLVGSPQRWGQVFIHGKSKGIEVNGIYEHYSNYGFQIKNDPNCDTTSWNNNEATSFVLDSINIHNFYVDSTSFEGTYIGGTLNTGTWSYAPISGGYRIACSGDTSYSYAFRMGHIKIHDGTITHTHQDGIQMVDVRYGYAEIYNCRLIDLGGIGNSGNNTQNHGMSLGGYNQGYVHDNYIDNAGLGIFWNGMGSITFARDTIKNSLANGMYLANSLDSPYHKIMSDSMIIRIHDCVLDSVLGGIVLTNYGDLLSSKSQVYSNTVTHAGQDSTFIPPKDPDGYWEGDYGGSVIDTSQGIRPWIYITSVDTSGSTITIHSVANNTMPKQFSIDGETWQSDSTFTNVPVGAYIASVRIDPALRDNQNRVYIAGTHTPPTAHAGTDNTLDAGTTSTTLSGSATAGDGTISTYSWSKVGTNGATIVSPDNQNTSITGLEDGKTYTFRLTVTDSNGLSDSDDVNVTIKNATPTIEIKLLLYIKDGKLIKVNTKK